jgi:hypothetical protein
VRTTTVLLCLAAAAPFVPAAWQIASGGVPEILFTGDGAALELRVLHAARGIQLLGPYSQWGWSHPGPAYFYLALPFYELLDHRGPALNVFALTINVFTAIGLVLTVRRLFDAAVALAAAALVTVFVLVGAPFLPANEWNPILPMLPLALLTLLTTRIAIGQSEALPAAVLLASLIVQTHAGYGAEIAALALIAVVARRGLPAVRRGVWLAAAVVLGVCWAFPIYEAVTTRPGNIQKLIAFFAPGNLGEQSWSAAWRSVHEQLLVMPEALARTLGLSSDATGAAATVLVPIQIAALTAALVAAARRRDRPLTTLSAIVLVQIMVAVVAIRAVRGDVLFYLVAWISVLGPLAWIVFAAWLSSWLQPAARRPFLQIAPGICSVAVIVLALRVSTPRPPVFREPDPAAESLARQVDEFLDSQKGARPVVRIRTRDTWPTAAAVVLHLYKRRVPIAVDPSWEFLFGRPLTALPGAQPELLVGDQAFHLEAGSERHLRLIGSGGGVYVYWDAME